MKLLVTMTAVRDNDSITTHTVHVYTVSPKRDTFFNCSDFKAPPLLLRFLTYFKKCFVSNKTADYILSVMQNKFYFNISISIQYFYVSAVLVHNTFQMTSLLATKHHHNDVTNAKNWRKNKCVSK